MWASRDRYFDPFRPTIEPNGFHSPEELVRSRATTIACFRDALAEADMLVFTLGLTECWRNAIEDYEYQSSPSIVKDAFDPERHRFHNQTVGEILGDMNIVFERMRRFNPDLKILLTVSPVPITATASDHHVLVAMLHTKSVLRAAAGELAAQHPFCDYFPSYEMVTGPPFRGMFYAPNLRAVTKHGIDFVMDRFFTAIEHDGRDRVALPATEPTDMDPLCDEELLDQFARL